MSRTFNPERQLNVLIVLDNSNSQNYGNKFEGALSAAFCLGQSAEYANDKLGLITFGNKVDYIEPSHDYQSVFTALMHVKSGRSDFTHALRKLSISVPINSLIVFISDFCFEIKNTDCDILRSLTVSNTLLSVILTNSSDHEQFNLISNDSIESFDIKNRLKKCRCKSIVVDTNNDKYLSNLAKYFLKNT